ncbi:MAG: hypothetical protein GY856_28220, partial [bacterium]|nr:hypothetical protein [bacterium]
GDLIVDNGTAEGGVTELPSLGSGVAQAASAGAVLVTDRGPIPAYFAGHWVEIRDPATGELEGSWRIAAVDGATVTLEPNGGETITVDPGDLWQGVYRFDNYAVRGDMTMSSSDPIRVTGTQEMAGSIELHEITADDLVLRSGTTLFHPPTEAATPESLRIELTGDLVIEAGAAIDVSYLGYPANTTYPDEIASSRGGSHLGYGGGGNTGSTYGSVYRPQENGAGGYWNSSSLRGGGTVRILAANLTLVDATSAIRANGSPGISPSPRGSAGGSVWITVSGAISGAGTIEAGGGALADGNNYGSGGGGAIAVEYAATSGAVLDHFRADGGERDPAGGAGTVYLNGPSSVYGDLIVDNGTAEGGVTELPSLGSGVAQAASAGAVLVTDRGAIPAYFVGHWVEIRHPATGELEGSWRIAAVDGATATLEPNGGETITVDPGDLWQGVYRFDNYAVRGDMTVSSSDPIRVAGTQEMAGSIELREITADDLILRSGTTLFHPATEASAAESLRIELTGDLVIEAGAAIDVSYLGYPANTTYPDEIASSRGGSHLGYGGGSSPGTTYGSVVRPQESGAGGNWSSSALRGGGAVRIIAANLTLVDATSAIRANGSPGVGPSPRGSAGGSVWITVSGAFSGDGTIETRGGALAEGTNYGSGGGGAIAVEYGAASGTVLGNLRAYGGEVEPVGGAGTVYLLGPTSTWGDLIVDNGGFPGANTELPALGSGTAQAGTSGALLMTDRGIAIPPYFVGHWVEIEAADGTPKGTWRIGAVDGVTATLVAEGMETISLADGDLWQGVYRFDEVTVTGGATLVWVDTVYEDGVVLVSKSGEWLAPNQHAPQLDPAAVTISVGRVADSYRIDVATEAVADADGIAEVRLSDGESWMLEPFSPTDGASFLWPGVPGRALTLTVIDAHAVLRRGRQIKLPPLPEGDWAVSRLTLPAGELPRHAIAGRDWVAVADRTVRIFASPGGELLAELAPLGAEDRTLGLAAGNGTLVAAHAGRLDIVTEDAFAEIDVASGEAIVDVVADEREAVVLVRSESDAELRLISLPLRGAAAELGFPRRGTNGGLSERSFFAIPDDGRSFELRLLPGSVQVIGSDPAGERPGVLYVFPNAALGEAITAEPEVWALDAGWRVERTWERGLILVAGPVARLLELSGDGEWREASRLALEREILAAAGQGDRVAFVLPGEILVFDVSDAATPRAVARIAGSAQRELRWIGELLLWSPGFAATPVVLEVEDWPAGKGGESGFVPVVDGRGEEIW